mmetsp:Transcript_62784/g.109676  ORF Transcript_62784/g.109676 Transcript_62784/m.109676 type:complete len:223 (+) Transcript_62784:835-1503(+)
MFQLLPPQRCLRRSHQIQIIRSIRVLSSGRLALLVSGSVTALLLMMQSWEVKLMSLQVTVHKLDHSRMIRRPPSQTLLGRSHHIRTTPSHPLMNQTQLLEFKLKSTHQSYQWHHRSCSHLIARALTVTLKKLNCSRMIRLQPVQMRRHRIHQRQRSQSLLALKFGRLAVVVSGRVGALWMRVQKRQSTLKRAHQTCQCPNRSRCQPSACTARAIVWKVEHLH